MILETDTIQTMVVCFVFVCGYAVQEEVIHTEMMSKSYAMEIPMGIFIDKQISIHVTFTF